jgi:hypothetical protein
MVPFPWWLATAGSPATGAGRFSHVFRAVEQGKWSEAAEAGLFFAPDFDVEQWVKNLHLVRCSQDDVCCLLQPERSWICGVHWMIFE